MTRVLLAAAVLAIVLVGVVIYCNAPNREKVSASEAREVLETPFHFLLKLPGYAEAQLAHDSDIFSTWGQLVLARMDGCHATRTEMLRTLTTQARNAGWDTAVKLDDVQTPDLSRHGIDSRREDLALQRTSASPGQNPPTRYGCRIWVSQDGGLIVVSWRVDGE